MSQHTPPPDPTLSFEHDDHFLGRRILPGQGHPVQSIAAPLNVIEVTYWFHLPRAALQKPPPPLGLTRVRVSPRQRARFMPGFTAAACRRLATAPASLYVNFRTASRWSAGILQRVMAGYISKVQVR
jgi:hypothetical protein